MEFKDKNVTVMGLGLHGGGAGLAQFLVNNGARVRITDLKAKDELHSSLAKLKNLPIDYHFGGHSWSDFQNADIVFVNPAVKMNSPWIQKIKKAGIAISSEINLFFELCPAEIIGITGTNGKTTTVNMVYQILQKHFADNPSRKIFLGGNVGGTLLNQLEQINENSIIILELSSFQLDSIKLIKKSPHVAVVLNIAPDHLDQHASFEEYVAAKQSIVEYQAETDFAILNADQKIARSFRHKTPAKIILFSHERDLSSGAYIAEDKKLIVSWRGRDEKIINRSEIKLPGEHNLENILAAVAVAAIYNVTRQEIVEVLNHFKLPPHRLEFVKTIKKVKYYNDSKATTPESTIAALRSFSDPVTLIVGGSKKNVDFTKLAGFIVRRVKTLILIGDAKKDIYHAVLQKLRSKKIAQKQRTLKKNRCYLKQDLSKAVTLAMYKARAGEVVLLSPACASFDQFPNFEERGREFKRLVKKV